MLRRRTHQYDVLYCRTSITQISMIPSFICEWDYLVARGEVDDYDSDVVVEALTIRCCMHESDRTSRTVLLLFNQMQYATCRSTEVLSVSSLCTFTCVLHTCTCT